VQLHIKRVDFGKCMLHLATEEKCSAEYAVPD